MGDIVRFPPSSMPPDLAKQVKALTSFFRTDEAHSPTVAPDAAADEWLRRRQTLLAEPSISDNCHGWFEELCCGINGVTEDLFIQRERAIWSMCRDLPACVWCDETLKRMWDRTSFLPSPGEVRQVLTAYLLPLRQEIRALERIVTAGQPKRALPEPAEPYVLPRPPEWALKDATHQGPKRDFAAEFEAKHGRPMGSLSAAETERVRAEAKAKAAASQAPVQGGPGSLSEAMLAAVRAAAAARAQAASAAANPEAGPAAASAAAAGHPDGSRVVGSAGGS